MDVVDGCRLKRVVLIGDHNQVTHLLASYALMNDMLSSIFSSYNCIVMAVKYPVTSSRETRCISTLLETGSVFIHTFSSTGSSYCATQQTRSSKA